MLKGIDARVTPDLLDCLMRMGHGDEIAVVDAHFPAHSIARTTTRAAPVALAGIDAPGAVGLICDLMPLDDMARHCALRMEVDGAPRELHDVHREALSIVMRSKPRLARVGRISREAYYKRAARAFAVVTTSELRPWGCFILRKGLVNEAGQGASAPEAETRRNEA